MTRLSLNPDYPLPKLHSVEELMGIALGMEREAALRYRQLHDRMEGLGEKDLAAVFRDLAVLEENHEQSLAEWAGREGRPVPQAVWFRWQLPETFSEADLVGAPLSAYQALAIAVRNEEQAFSFYSYLSAMTDLQPDLRRYADALASEELSHIAQLRRLRRGAYHAQHAAGRRVFPKLSDVTAFYRFAWGVESGSAFLCRLLADRMRRTGEATLTALLDRIGEECARRAVFHGEVAGGSARPPGTRVVESVRAKEQFPLLDLSVRQVLDLCEKDAREALDDYLSVAEAANEESLLLAAQDMAEKTMARLAILRSMR